MTSTAIPLERLANEYPPRDTCEPVQLLTDRQREIYKWLFDETLKRTHQPSFRELIQHFMMSGPNAVRCHLNALAKKGYVHLNKNRSRGLTLLRTPDGEPFHGFQVRAS